jgi:hypothetical protein
VERRVLSGGVHPMGSQGCLVPRVCPCHSEIGENTRGLKE